MNISPTTPSRRPAGMLDFESPARESFSPSMKHTDSHLQGTTKELNEDTAQTPSTPSLLSRLFSWGTPSSAVRDGVCFFSFFYKKNRLCELFVRILLFTFNHSIVK